MHTHFSYLWERVADATPNAPAVVQGARAFSWREYDTRAARLAQAFLDAGLGAHSKVGMYLYNSPEYCETNYAAMKIRAVPVNVNYRYLDDELAYLLDNSDSEALVYHSSLADRVARVAPRMPKLKLLVEVDDGPASDGAHDVARAVRYDDVQRTKSPAARVAPHGDEIYMFYTGGTTGMPKGVMYPLSGFTEFFLKTYPQMVGLAPVPDPSALPGLAKQLRDAGQATVAMSGPPLMHGTGCWLGMMVPHLLGGTAVLLEKRGLDPVELWSTVARERVNLLVVVGDAFAKPMLRALEENPGALGCVVPRPDGLERRDVLARGEAGAHRAAAEPHDRGRARLDGRRHGHVVREEGRDRRDREVPPQPDDARVQGRRHGGEAGVGRDRHDRQRRNGAARLLQRP